MNTPTTEDRLFWNPSAGVRRIGHSCQVAGCTFPRSASETIEAIADLTTTGATSEEITASCPGAGDVRRLVTSLKQLGVLIAAPMGIKQLTHGQASILGEPLLTDQELVDPEKNAAFRARQASRRPPGTRSISLPSTQLPPWLAGRRSVRRFSTDPVTRQQLGQLLAPLRHRPCPDLPEGRRGWPSAGGLYEIDCFLDVKPNRVESIGPGIYAFDPVANALVGVDGPGNWGESFHYLSNRAIHNSSALTAILVMDLAVIMPKYRDLGYPLALIDAGIVAATIGLAACDARLGSCCIGDFDFDGTHEVLHLRNTQQVVHAIEIGTMEEQS
mgnify:CR=1 FL=1